MGTVALCCLCILLGAAFGVAATDHEMEGAAAFLGVVFMAFLVSLGGWLAN